MNINVSPIVLFVYNRPAHTKKTIDALARNELANKSELFIFSDGAKNSDTIGDVNAVRDILYSSHGFKKIEIIERESNFGLAANIIDGVTKIINEYGRVIVLEDDIVTAPYFLSFMNRALDFYKDEKKMWHISGWNYPIDPKGLGDTFLWRVMNCWGWATWSDRWESFERKPERLINKWSSNMIHRFNLDGAYDFWDQVKANYEGRLNTWAIFWYASIFERNGLCMQPSVSLVHNSGFDGTGENCSNAKTYDSSLSTKEEWVFDVSFMESDVATQRIKHFYKQTRKSFSQRIFLHLYHIYKKTKRVLEL